MGGPISLRLEKTRWKNLSLDMECEQSQQVLVTVWLSGTGYI